MRFLAGTFSKWQGGRCTKIVAGNHRHNYEVTEQLILITKWKGFKQYAECVLFVLCSSEDQIFETSGHKKYGFQTSKNTPCICFRTKSLSTLYQLRLTATRFFIQLPLPKMATKMLRIKSVWPIQMFAVRKRLQVPTYVTQGRPHIGFNENFHVELKIRPNLGKKMFSTQFEMFLLKPWKPNVFASQHFLFEAKIFIPNWNMKFWRQRGQIMDVMDW